MTAPRDDYGDRIRSAEVEHEWAATDADRRSNQPRTRTVAPKTGGGGRPMWADEFPEAWSE